MPWRPMTYNVIMPCNERKPISNFHLQGIEDPGFPYTH